MKLRILFADADSTLSRVSGEFFSHAGFEVEMAASGIECVEKLRRLQVDVLVIDADLPWGGAEGVLDRIGGDPAVPWVPITIAAGDALPEVLADRFDLPLQWCVRKPFRLSELLKRIRRAAFVESEISL